MRDLSARGSLLNPSTLQTFLVLRMIVVALVVGAGIMIVQLSQDAYPVGPLYVLFGLSFAIGGAAYAGMRLKIDPAVIVWTLMVGDILVETAILHHSGGATSQFSLIFCLSIIAGAFLLQARGGVVIALLASVAYVCYGVLEARGVFTPPGAGVSAEASAQGVLQSYMHVSLFLLVGLVSGHLADRIRWKGKELQSAQTQLQQLRLDTDNILNNMSSGVIVVDSSGSVLKINPTAEQILEVTHASAVGNSVNVAFEKRLPELARELTHALIAGTRKERHEFTIHRPDGRVLPLGLSASRLRDENGDRRGVIAVFQDLTQVRDMQARVRKADRLAAIGELSAGIAHEIRNPLASISGSIEMLSNELKVDGENRRLMELIMKESDRLDRIINDFLEFARLRPPSKSEMTLIECLEDVLVLLRNNPAVRATIQTHISGNSRDVVALFDEEQMKQVLLNLAINGAEAAGPDGTLAIHAELAMDGCVAVRFKDDGPGVDEEACDRLFEPFFTTKEGGTGLGLAIANKIVEAHGGRLEFRNRERGGAEFSVILPPARVNEPIQAESTSVVSV